MSAGVTARHPFRVNQHPARPRKPAGMVFRRSAPAPGRYGALLLLLIVSYLLSAFLPNERWVGGLQVVLFTVAGVLALRNSTVSRRAVRLLMVVAVIGVPVFFAISFSSATG